MFSILSGFFSYEMMQAKNEGLDSYFTDPWNYLELFEFLIWNLGAIVDFMHNEVQESTRILLVFSVFFSLIKFLHLSRCFTGLS